MFHATFVRRRGRQMRSRHHGAHVASHTGLKAIVQEDYRGWHLVVEHRSVGMTLQRDQYSVRVSNATSGREEYLAGFASKVMALRAARRRVDFIVDIQEPRMPRPRVRRRGAAHPLDR